jgi:hypothetical protein
MVSYWGRAGMGMGRLPHADSGVSHSLPVPPSHTLLQPPPRRLLVHRAHVVLFSYYVAATTIAPLCSNIALSCDPHSARAYRTRAYALYLHYTSSRADHIAYCPYALFRLSQSARSLLPTQPTRGHNRDRFLCSSVVLLPILGRCPSPSFDLNAAIVPANKPGPTTLPML